MSCAANVPFHLSLSLKRLRMAVQVLSPGLPTNAHQCAVLAVPRLLLGALQLGSLDCGL